MRTVFYHPTPIGMLVIEENEAGICRLAREESSQFRPDVAIGETPLLAKAARELDEYFAGTRQRFDLPLSPEGTPFQKRVWEALNTIPYGETCSYGEIAAQVGNAKASRAVGMANHSNPIMIVVPCHRVVGKDGKLTGYASGLQTKQYLLEFEKSHK